MMQQTRWFSRERVGRFVLSPIVQRTIIVVILINAAVLGLETIRGLSEPAALVLHLLDKICLGIFVVEIALKLYAQRLRFFRDAWNVFDFLVVGVALIPGSDGLAVLRALRVLRVLRLVSVVPALRRVVDALMRAIPGIASIAVLLVIIFYVGAVMATTLFGDHFPELFGSLGTSLFSLFQVTTLDNWSSIAREVATVLPWAPFFFVPFVLVSALTVLNLFIAVIVDAMQGIDRERADASPAVPAGGDRVSEQSVLVEEVRLLQEQVTALTAAVEGARGSERDASPVG
ncbi:ion transporter [Microbacterium sp. NIBRBAC000506063]|uniref:ion transporter n=1 Tax=Microbacterium sp. NIBRBAC000506063 TaxID=2734618 RepID=UPI001BB6627D|nr:ion transporter [Microbacterium sp. NIBRBAC000506063]QTV79230.1 ion transporter [Microbacterium sp. NIBRBAC000506063]